MIKHPSRLVTAPVSRWEPDSPAPLGRYARYAHVFFNPQSLRDSPVGHWEPDSPDPLGRYARYAHVFFNPQSLRDSPGGALGAGFPSPLVSLRALCARFFSTPSHFVTAPVGHWGPDSPDPLGRYAPSGVITSG